MSQLDAALTGVPLTLTFDLEFSRSNCISGMGGQIVMERRGTGVDRMPWCETVKKWVNGTLRWLGYFWPLPLTLYFQGQIVSRNGRPDSHGTKGTGVYRIPWCKRQPLCDLEAEDTVRDQGDLRCPCFLRLILVTSHSFMWDVITQQCSQFRYI